MPHAQLTDAQWQRLEPLLLGKPVEGILWIARTGAPWRDLQSPSTRCRPGKGGRSPAESRPAQAVGRSRGGLTTKLLALTAGRGQLVQFRLRPGNAAEGEELPALLADVPLTATREPLGDKAYDSDGVRGWLASVNITATIPDRSHRKEPVGFDERSYQRRHLVENAFSDLKQFRGIA